LKLPHKFSLISANLKNVTLIIPLKNVTLMVVPKVQNISDHNAPKFFYSLSILIQLFVVLVLLHCVGLLM